MRTTLAIVLALSVCIPALAQDGSDSTSNPTILIKTSMGDIEAVLYQDAAPKTVANFLGLAEGTKEWGPDGAKQKKPFYDGLIFHRVIKGFMLQGGCPQGTGMGGPGFSFPDEINAKALGLDKIKAMETPQKPHAWLGVRTQQDFQRLIVQPMLKKLGITNSEQFKARLAEVQKNVNAMTLMDAYSNQGYVYSDKGSGHKPMKGFLAMANSGPNTNGSQFFINLIDTPWLTGKHTVFGKVTKGFDIVEKIGETAVGAGSKPLTDVKILSIRRK